MKRINKTIQKLQAEAKKEIKSEVSKSTKAVQQKVSDKVQQKTEAVKPSVPTIKTVQPVVTTNSKKVVVPGAKVKAEYRYKTVSSDTIKTNISGYIAKAGKLVKDRIAERKLNVSSIVKISKQVQQQYLNDKLRSTATKYYFTLKDGSTKVFNFSEYYSK